MNNYKAAVVRGRGKAAQVGRMHVQEALADKVRGQMTPTEPGRNGCVTGALEDSKPSVTLH